MPQQRQGTTKNVPRERAIVAENYSVAFVESRSNRPIRLVENDGSNRCIGGGDCAQV